MVGGGRGNNVAVASDLPGEPLNGPGDLSRLTMSILRSEEGLQNQIKAHIGLTLVNFTEDDDAREACSRIIGDGGVK